MSKINIKAGSRGSRLALIQVEEVKNLLAQKKIHVDFDVKTYTTQGDRDKTTPLTANPADDFFTDTLDKALLKNEIDVAIHSAKDVPQQLREGLTIFALTPNLDETDAFVGRVKFANLPAGAKVGTSSLLRESNIKSLNPGVQIVNVRGTIEERLRLVDQGQCDGIVVATAALKRLGLQNRITEIMPWETTALQGQLAIVGRTKNSQMKKIFEPIDARKTFGKVILVGAGPGDPDLITVKGVQALQKADYIFYDYLIHKDVLKHAPKAHHIYVGKRKGKHTVSQSELSQWLRQKAIEGKTVVRLKGGDPFIFGRGADEISYLQSYHIPVEVIPGISSATGIPSGLGIPLTARDMSSSVAFVSGYEKGEREDHVHPIKIPNVDTIVFLMGLTKLNVIVDSLKKAQWKVETPIIVISKGTRIDEKIVTGTLNNIEQKVYAAHLEPPALIVVGEIVKFWKGKPAHHEGILYTGTNPEKYTSLGDIVHLPMIEIREASLSQKTIQTLKKKWSSYEMILFTSRYAVKHFMQILKDNNFTIQDLKNKKLVVIGKDTADMLLAYDFEYDLIADVETGEGLLKALKEKYNLKAKKILFPRSSLPNLFLKKHLKKLGAHVDELTVYNNIKPPKRPLPKEEIQKILFTSPSTVENFLKNYGRIPKGWRILSKGPLTAHHLKNKGYKSEIVIYG